MRPPPPSCARAMRTARSNPATGLCWPSCPPAGSARTAAPATATCAPPPPPPTGAVRLLRGGHRLREDADAGGGEVYHHLGVSAFATHAVIDHRSAVKIPSDIPPEIAALFGCAVLTGVGAVLNTAQVRMGESVAVYGLGGVGLSAVLGAGGGRRPAYHRHRPRGVQAGARP